MMKFQMLFRMKITITFADNGEDSRRCMFCQNVGDGAADNTGRLLNFDVDKWVHLNCALWSEDVYETVNGALMNLDIALKNSKDAICILCKQPGATVKCFKIRCSSYYHLGCAVRDSCVFYKNKVFTELTGSRGGEFSKAYQRRTSYLCFAFRAPIARSTRQRAKRTTS